MCHSAGDTTDRARRSGPRCPEASLTHSPDQRPLTPWASSPSARVPPRLEVPAVRRQRGEKMNEFLEHSVISSQAEHRQLPGRLTERCFCRTSATPSARCSRTRVHGHRGRLPGAGHRRQLHDLQRRRRRHPAAVPYPGRRPDHRLNSHEPEGGRQRAAASRTPTSRTSATPPPRSNRWPRSRCAA